MTKQIARSVVCRVVGLGAAVLRTALGAGMRRIVPMPQVDVVPEGRIVDLPGRGRTFVIDVAGPTPTAPTIILLHALGCTAYLSWVATIGELSRKYRVITFDQRWHGRGIRSPRFRFADCADDVVGIMDELGVNRAVIAGYSMGGAVAQLTWQRHRDRVAGLVLCSTARNYRGTRRERLFFPLVTAAMHPLSGYALARVERLAETLPEVPSVEAADPVAWGRVEFRSTSAWSLPEVLGELGRFNSAPWISEVDVPTAVVVTERDHTIPERRQRGLAAAIDGAQVRTAPGGHASLFLDAAKWVPVFLDAVKSVTERLEPSSEVAV
ncbi:MAG TPA: alpha/beta fold hydrolase [Nocardioidaceae bacterium]|nr:alpha/beta fold hydrolase [Nocardioidaceae bacterium]